MTVIHRFAFSGTVWLLLWNGIAFAVVATIVAAVGVCQQFVTDTTAATSTAAAATVCAIWNRRAVVLLLLSIEHLMRRAITVRRGRGDTIRWLLFALFLFFAWCDTDNGLITYDWVPLLVTVTAGVDAVAIDAAAIVRVLLILLQSRLGKAQILVQFNRVDELHVCIVGLRNSFVLGWLLATTLVRNPTVDCPLSSTATTPTTTTSIHLGLVGVFLLITDAALMSSTGVAFIVSHSRRQEVLLLLMCRLCVPLDECAAVAVGAIGLRTSCAAKYASPVDYCCCCSQLVVLDGICIQCTSRTAKALVSCLLLPLLFIVASSSSYTGRLDHCLGHRRRRCRITIAMIYGSTCRGWFRFARHCFSGFLIGKGDILRRKSATIDRQTRNEKKRERRERTSWINLD